MSVMVAVVIPTYRRPELLRRCLMALLQQSMPKDQYQIIVVDDAPSEDTRAVVGEVAQASGGQPVLRYMRSAGTRGPAGARNRGWRVTDAPLIAFTDDDTVPDPDWLLQGWQAMAAIHVAAVSGRVVVPVAHPPTDHARVTQALERAEFVTANAFVRRDVLAQTGGFDERFTRPWREDSDLLFSLLERGAAVARAEQAVVVHPVRPAPWGVSMRQQANVSFDALLYRKHPQLFRSKIRNRPPWNYFAIVAASLLAVLTWALGWGAVAAGAALVAVLGIAAFAMRRLRGTSHALTHVLEMVVTSFAIPYLAVFWRAVGVWRFKTFFP